MRQTPFTDSENSQDTQRAGRTDRESKKEYTLGLMKVVDGLRLVEVMRDREDCHCPPLFGWSDSESEYVCFLFSFLSDSCMHLT